MQLLAATRGLGVILLGSTFVSCLPETESPSAAGAKQAAVNELAGESSLYLRMHAHNPVQWHPWGPEAFALAKEKNKPVFLSVGYSSCYWCHVMERLVFENAEIAKLMNEQFVCIKVDREERPDVDDIYMTALHVYYRATGVESAGGWPLSMFLMPDGKPIAGGSYFPPEDTEHLVGFPTVLKRMSQLWENDQEKLAANAEIIATETRRVLQPRLVLKTVPLDAKLVDECTQRLVASADPVYGGVGFDADRPRAPKFPIPGDLAFLQQQSAISERSDIDDVLALTLRQIALGGVRDHLAGGFHRYSVNREWSIPHFEKMLYDQAQLAAVYTEACRQASNPLYQSAACETLDFVLREMTTENGLFAASLDAETNSVEGAYYVWSLDEVQQALGEDADLFVQAYGIEAQPEFEHGNVLRLNKPLPELAVELKLEAQDLSRRLAEARAKLLVIRENRTHPARDDKVITGWNGLMIGALANAGKVFDRKDYLAAAGRSAKTLLSQVRDADGRLLRSLPTEKRKSPAFLDDYAFLISGLLNLHDATGDDQWRQAAVELQAQQDEFFTHINGGYFQTPQDNEELLVRSKTNSDGVLPGGNSTAIRNLLRLAQLTGNDEYRQRAAKGLEVFSANLQQSPLGNANLAAALSELLHLPAISTPQNAGSSAAQPPGVAQAAFADDATAAAQIELTAAQGTSKEAAAKPKEQVKAKVFLSVDKLPAGGQCKFVVILDVQEGWHINANPPDPEEMIPTKVTVASKLELKQGDTKYPEGKKLVVDVFPNPVAVYEKQVEIRGVIDVPAAAGGKTDELEFQVRYQACNDKTCLPPKTIKLSNKIEVAKQGVAVKQANQKYFPSK